MKTTKNIKRSLRRLIVILLMILSFCSGFFGHTLLNARAEEKEPALNRYYTSIQIRQGDTLWKLAEQYCEGSRYSRVEYVEELKRMNGLKSEQIHSGEYLTVVYFAE